MTGEKTTLVMGFGAILLTIGMLLGACSRTTVSSSTAQSGSALGETTVNVTTDEMSINLETTPRQAGKITFVVTNRGNTAHDFVLSGNGREYRTKTIPPGSTQSLTVDLAPGSYDFVCSIPGHALLGMRGSFTLS